MVRSSVPQKQFPIGDPPPSQKKKFPVAHFSNVIKGKAVSVNSSLPAKGSIVTLDLGKGQTITGEILDYFTMLVGTTDIPKEYVQVRVGNNIYLRPSENIKA